MEAEKLAEFVDRFRLAVENSVIGFIVFDATSGRALEVNAAAVELFGRDESDLLGMTWRELTHPDERDQGDLLHASFTAGNIDILTIRKRYLRGDVQALFADVVVTAVRDESARHRYHIAQIRDAMTDLSFVALTRLVADLPDGEVLATAVLGGMFETRGMRSVVLLLHEPNRRLMTVVGGLAAS